MYIATTPQNKHSKKKKPLQIFPQWIYQETEKHMKALGLLKALCI